MQACHGVAELGHAAGNEYGDGAYRLRTTDGTMQGDTVREQLNNIRRHIKMTEWRHRGRHIPVGSVETVRP